MTNKNKGKRAARPGTVAGRPPAQGLGAANPSKRRGLLDAIFSPRVAGTSSMPRIRTSLARGVVTVAGTPILLVTGVAIVAAQWLAALALGYQGPFALFVTALALPPVGTSFDATLSTSLFGLRGGFFAILGFVMVRAAIQALLVAAIVEVLRGSPLGRWTLVRALRALPVALAVNVAGVGLLTLGSLIGPLLGTTFVLLIQLATLIGGVYLLSFALVIAADEDRRMSDALGRAVRAARLPGSGNLSLAAIYVVGSVALLVAPGKPGSELGVNPSVSAWVVVLVANLLHLIMQAVVAFRYLSVAAEVPEGPAQRRPERRRQRAEG
jgi:hypothetical protein